MKRHTLQFKQVNANTYRAITQMSGKIAFDSLSYKEKSMVFVKSIGRKVPMDVTKSIARKNRKTGVTFPSGLVSFIMRKANDKGHDCEFDYIEPYVLKKKLIPSLPGIKFESFQAKMLRKVGIYRRGILVGPTAMGKSIVLGGIIDKMNVPETILITPTQTIFNQLYDRLSNWFGEDKVGRIGQGIKDQRHITICMYQSIENYKAKRSLKMVLIDEAHLINNTIINFLKSKCNHVYYRYGVTATPHKRKDNFVKSMQMIGYLGPIICEVSDNEASNRVLPVKVKLVSFYCGKPKGENYQEVLRKDLLMSPLRNVKLLKATHEYALSKGMTALFLLDETEQGKLVEKLAKEMGITATLVHGGLRKTFINGVITKLNSRKIKFVIATRVFGVGTDIPNIDCVTLGSCRKSEVDTLQKIGRGRRRVKGSDHLILIDAVDKIRGNKFNKYFYNHAIQRLNIYKEKGWEIERLMF